MWWCLPVLHSLCMSIHHIYVVCVSYFPRKSLSKPQTDTPWIHHSNSDKLKMWTCYITHVSLGTSQGFLHAVPKVLLSVRIQLLTTKANAKVIKQAWIYGGRIAGAGRQDGLPGPHLSSYSAVLSPLPPIFFSALQTVQCFQKELPLPGGTAGANQFIWAGKPVSYYIKDVPVLQYIN